MYRLSTSALLLAGLTDLSEAYKVRRWADMYKKKPCSEQLMNELVTKYDVIYTLAFNALVDADKNDGFQVQEKFGINLQNKMAEGTGLHRLVQLKSFAEARNYNLDEPEVPQEWLKQLRETFDNVEKEMLRVNAALSYASGYMDLTDTKAASQLRGQRQDFIYNGQLFE
jgi:hypothetical protein